MGILYIHAMYHFYFSKVIHTHVDRIYNTNKYTKHIIIMAIGKRIYVKRTRTKHSIIFIYKRWRLDRWLMLVVHIHTDTHTRTGSGLMEIKRRTTRAHTRGAGYFHEKNTRIHVYKNIAIFMHTIAWRWKL